MYNQVPVVDEDKDQFNSTLFNNLSVQGLISPRGTVFDRSLDQKDIERETDRQRREDVEEDGPQDQRILAKAMQLAYQMAERAGRQSDQMGLGGPVPDPVRDPVRDGAPTFVDLPASGTGADHPYGIPYGGGDPVRDGDYVLVKKKQKSSRKTGPFAKKAPARSVGSQRRQRTGTGQQQQKNPATTTTTRWKV